MNTGNAGYTFKCFSLLFSLFQTSLRLTLLPLHCVIIACRFRVTVLSSHTALALSPSGIAPKVNRILLSAVCHFGQSRDVIDNWQDAAHCSVFLLQQVALSLCCSTNITIKVAMQQATSLSEKSLLIWIYFCSDCW